jgi:hypothetical protein
MAYELEDDVDAGYKKAVDNNQTNLALRYLNAIIERQTSDIADLKAELKELKSTPKQAVASAPKRVPAAAKKGVDASVVEDAKSTKG